MHNHDDKYPARLGFEPGTLRLQANDVGGGGDMMPLMVGDNAIDGDVVGDDDDGDRCVLN